METAAAKKKKIVSMTRACASVAAESCGIIFRVIHPPRRAPTAKQISAMSDLETEKPAAPPIRTPYRGNRSITRASKFVSGPKGHVVNVSPRRRLLQELAGVKNTVIRL